MSATRRQFVALTSGLLAASSVDAATWNQWRGPSRDGVVDGEKPWPEKVSGDHLQQLWRVDLQPSYSGPIVSGNHVFVTQTMNKKNEAATALSLETGERVWTAEWSGSMRVPFYASSNGSWIRSTPAVSGDKLLIAGMLDVLVCLHPETGEEIWRNDFVQTQGTKPPPFGFVCSPLIEGDHAYVQAGGGLLKLEMATGKVVWRSLVDGGGTYGSAFSSPVLAEVAGVKQLLVQTRKDLAGVDPTSGKKLWSVEVPAFRGMNILPPTPYGDSIFTSSYGGGTFCFELKNSGDGQLSVATKWKNSVQGYMSSPLVFDDHVYFHLKNQRFTCMSLETGEQKWSSRPFGKYWSSLSQGNNRILALDERGELLLVQPQADKFNLLDRQKVAANSWAHLAVVDDLILVRDLESLSVYRWS